MAIYQLNLFVCEICGKIESTTAEVSAYDDPLVDFPNENEPWGYSGQCPNEKLTCPECMKGLKKI